jgi:inosine triphosphate pyrophosphatase
MQLYFITGNAGKLAEMKAIIPQLEGLNIDLPEIQHTDALKIVEAKLHEAIKQQEGSLIVEDTSLYFNALNGLPGPFIKWFLESLGHDGLYKLADSFGDTTAYAKTTIGYTDGAGTIKFFEGRIDGEIVKPRGNLGFGWGPVFLPNGHDKTFGEMTNDEKNELSMRRLAAEELKSYLASL